MSKPKKSVFNEFIYSDDVLADLPSIGKKKNFRKVLFRDNLANETEESMMLSIPMSDACYDSKVIDALQNDYSDVTDTLEIDLYPGVTDQPIEKETSSVKDRSDDGDIVVDVEVLSGSARDLISIKSSENLLKDSKEAYSKSGDTENSTEDTLEEPKEGASENTEEPKEDTVEEPKEDEESKGNDSDNEYLNKIYESFKDKSDEVSDQVSIQSVEDKENEDQEILVEINNDTNTTNIDVVNISNE